MRREARMHRISAVNNLRENNRCTPYSGLIHIVSNSCNHDAESANTEHGIIPLLRTIKAVVKGEIDTNGQYTVGAFSFLLFILFKFLGGIGMTASALLAIADLISIFSHIMTGHCDLWVLGLLVCILLILGLVFIYSVMVWGAAAEIEKEKDKNYVLAVFSGVVSLASLIVSLIVFLQEVR